MEKHEHKWSHGYISLDTSELVKVCLVPRCTATKREKINND